MSTMTILTNFVPIHELDDVLYDSDSNYRSDVLKDEDLFLISQLSALSSPERDSIILSKKLQYNTLKQKISDDIDIQGVKDNINELCTNLNELCTVLSSYSGEDWTFVLENGQEIQKTVFCYNK